MSEAEKKEPIKYIALESYWISSQDVLGEVFGERLASALWVSKDMDPRDPSAIRTFEKVEKWISEQLDAGAKGRVRIDVSEKSTVLDPRKILDDAEIEAESFMKTQNTGFGDIDWTMEKIVKNGFGMEGLHSAAAFKDKIENLFLPDGFEELEPLYRPLREPIKDLLRELDDDLEKGIQDGLRHPYCVTIGVGCITLEMTLADGRVVDLPISRKQKITPLERVADRVKDEVESFRKELADGNLELQSRLRNLPDGWPNDAAYSKAQEIAGKRFNGDNGLGTSDFYDGRWPELASNMEIHVDSMKVDLNQSVSVMPRRVNFAEKIPERSVMANKPLKI